MTSVLSDSYIVPPSEIFLGCSYGDWAVKYMNWLVGPRPDIHDDNNILFLHGSMSNPYSNNSYNSGSTPDYNDPTLTLKKTYPDGYFVNINTSVILSPLFSHLSVGETYNGRTFNSVTAVRNEITSEINSSPMIEANIYKLDKGYARKPGTQTQIVENLQDYIIESPIFSLTIPSDSTLAENFDLAFEREKIYDNSIFYGCLIILKRLPDLEPDETGIQIDFGGIADNGYVSHGIFDIFYKSQMRSPIINKLPKDTSSIPVSK